MQKDSKIFIAGHLGMVGSAIHRFLLSSGYTNLIVKKKSELDLTNSELVQTFFYNERPEYVFLAAAKVGGIMANINFSGEFIFQNLKIQTNVIHSSCAVGVKRLLFLGSSCIYPKHAPIPILEKSLLSGIMEETNLPYAISKIAGIVMCNAYRKQFGFDAFTVMPSNVYGIGDNFNPSSSHVIAGIMKKMHEANITGGDVTLWGTGKPLREFIFSEDLAEACVFLMQNYFDGHIINVGSGNEISICELARKIASVTCFKQEILFDSSFPDGVYSKKMDCSKINSLGWYPKTEFNEGLKKMYEWYLNTL